MNKLSIQGSRNCGSTGAALLGSGRPTSGNDAYGEKEKEEEIKEEKRGKERGKGRWRGKGKEEEEGTIFLQMLD